MGLHLVAVVEVVAVVFSYILLKGVHVFERPYVSTDDVRHCWAACVFDWLYAWLLGGTSRRWGVCIEARAKTNYDIRRGLLRHVDLVVGLGQESGRVGLDVLGVGSSMGVITDEEQDFLKSFLPEYRSLLEDLTNSH